MAEIETSSSETSKNWAGQLDAVRSQALCHVLLADDHAMILDMLQMLLPPEFTVIGSVRDGAELVEAACTMQPDIALIDIHLPGMGGLEAGQRIHARAPRVKLVFMTMDRDADLAASAFAAGASGYVLKAFPTVELLHALRVVARGGLYFAASMAGVKAMCPPYGNAQSDGYSNNRAHNVKARLSQREQEVIQLLVQGLPMKEVARRLGISPRTVAFHKYHSMATLRLRRNSDLVRFAIEHGMLNQEALKQSEAPVLSGTPRGMSVQTD